MAAGPFFILRGVGGSGLVLTLAEVQWIML
jgi:hypothetical protein